MVLELASFFQSASHLQAIECLKLAGQRCLGDLARCYLIPDLP